MKREDVIRLAKEASMMDGYSLNTEKLKRFAALVAAAERERVAKEFDSSPNAEMFRQDIAAEIRALGDE